MPYGRGSAGWFTAAVAPRVVGLLLGGLLFFAAILKLLGLASYASLSLSGVARAWQAALVGLEVSLAAALVWSTPSRTLWRLASGFFLMAASASAATSMMGRQSCGCFGMLRVPPYVSLCASLGALLLLHICRGVPAASQRRPGFVNLVALGLAVAVAAAVGGPRYAGWQASRRLPRVDSDTAVFDTLDWLGRPFPAWNELIHGGVPNAWRNHCVLLLARPGCSSCEWMAAGEDLARLSARVPVVVVRVGAAAESGRHHGAESGRLVQVGVASHEWGFPMPAIVVIRGGRVVEAYHGQQAVEWVAAHADLAAPTASRLHNLDAPFGRLEAPCAAPDAGSVHGTTRRGVLVALGRIGQLGRCTRSTPIRNGFLFQWGYFS